MKNMCDFTLGSASVKLSDIIRSSQRHNACSVFADKNYEEMISPGPKGYKTIFELISFEHKI